ncbi:MAG TPA: hypothetical protein VF530_16300 [Planctomycetota bacterium]
MSGGPSAPGPLSGSRRDPAGLLVAVGVLHALLFLASYALIASGPDLAASDGELAAFYASPGRRRLVLVGLYVMPFAGIAFLWFSMGLRGWLRAGALRAAELVWGLYLASSVLYVALFFCGAAATSVVALASEHARATPDPLLLREFPQFGGTLFRVFAMRMAAMFVFTTSRLGQLAGVVPRWYGRVGLVTGLFLLVSTSTGRWMVLVFPLWLLGLCAHLWRRRRAVPAP